MRVAAVDLGATSARVAVVDGERPDHVEVVHRYPHQPVVHADGSLRWDWAGLVREVKHGLRVAARAGALDSIGVDAWGVDYGLLGADEQLLSPPYSYRDSRTSGWRTIAARLGEQRLYELTGVQLLGINTIFQLAVHDRDELAKARSLLMLPELMVHELTGVIIGEYSSWGTTGFGWGHLRELAAEVGVPSEIFPYTEAPGTAIGEWQGVPVHLVAGHDTASAVHARPGPSTPDRAFVSTGSWVLVGVERPTMLTSADAFAANFSNEWSLNGFRFLKNVTGLWLLERCRAAWGGDVPEPAMIVGPVVDTDDVRFVDTADMPAAIAAAAGLSVDDRPAIVRCVYDSIASAVARVIAQLSDVTGTPITEIDMFGGGAQIPMLVELVGAATGLPVLVGSPEATALGNAKVQFAALRGS